MNGPRYSMVSLLTLMLSGCATESHRTIKPQRAIDAAAAPYSGPRRDIVLGAVDNKSAYMNGVFAAEGPDRLGLQARQILKTHLSQSGRFTVLDRVNLDTLRRESEFLGQESSVKGAKAVITGAVTEFGRKVVGERGLGGLLYRSKRQVAYAKVAVSIVDVETSRVLLSAQGAGEYQLGNAEVVGFGGHAGYDATLNDKVLNLAMIEAVRRITEGMDKGEWTP